MSAIPDTDNFPARYRLSAEQCRRRADAAVDEVSKTSWLRFAEEWMKLADEAEQVGPGPSNAQPSGSHTRRF